MLFLDMVAPRPPYSNFDGRLQPWCSLLIGIPFITSPRQDTTVKPVPKANALFCFAEALIRRFDAISSYSHRI